MRVLLVEDDAISQRIISNYLAKWGYEFELVTDGEAAWKRLQDDDFPLVITDWIMPELDGFQLIRRLRTKVHRPGYIYTILLTGQSDKENLVAALDAGADDFLAKPFDRDELRVRLRKGERLVQRERKTAADAHAIGVSLDEAMNGWQHVASSGSPGDPVDSRWQPLQSQLMAIRDAILRLADDSSN